MRVLIIQLCLVCLIAAIGNAQSVRPYSPAKLASTDEITFLDISPDLYADGATIVLPTPAGKEIEVTLSAHTALPARLQEKYPSIRGYRGLASDGSSVIVSSSNSGMRVYVYATGRESWAIEPIGNGQARMGLSSVLAVDGSARPAPALGCGTVADTGLGELLTKSSLQSRGGAQEKVMKRKYILALATTGEFGRRYGGTKASVMETLNEAVSILNAITLTEVGAEFELHPFNDTLIFTNPAVDPYTNADEGGALLGQNPTVINNRIPLAEYDIGHVFTNRCVDVGGVVSGRACNASGKARGVTCHYSNLRTIVEDVMAHEVAHQFAVGHSWNNCPGNDGQRAGGTAFEPGSGSTIMSYQGACGPDNNVRRVGGSDYYHVASLDQFISFTTTGTGANCADFEEVENDFPEIDWPYTSGFSIPRSTPFILSAEATDPNGDALLYNWEQYNLGPATDLCEPEGDAPIFRSVPPAANRNVRFFPDQNVVRTLSVDCEQLLPDYGRGLSFRMTVRDGRPEGGGTVWEQVDFGVAEEAGPFRVTSQASRAVTLAAGTFVNVTWDVANTDVAPVNCAAVNILLSMDDGLTFPFVLAEATNNDGEEGVTLPAISSDQARIKIEAADNIFYALSDSRFNIVEPTEPGFTFVASESTAFLCLPELAEVDLFTSSLLEYDSTVTVRIVSDIPEGIVATLDTARLTPGEAALLTVDFSDWNQTDSVTVTVEATGPDVDTARRTILFDVVGTDFSDLELISPAPGEVGVSGSPTFTFEPTSRATDFLLEVSDDPNFGLSAFQIFDPDPNGEQLGSLLEPNTVYFWRVVPSNRCVVDYSVPINAFATFAASCETFGQDEPINIPPRVRVVTEAEIEVASSGPVSDLNVPLVDVFYQDIRDTRIELESPSGTVVTLLENRCGGIGRLITGFDDESPLEFSCTPIPTDGQIRQPREPLSTFNGEDIQGIWKLKVEVTDPSNDGGDFRAFAVEFCADIVSAKPNLELNTVTVPTGKFQFLDRSFLSARDEDNASSELEYIIVSAPMHGRIELDGDTLGVGDRFFQSQTSSGRVIYVDERGEEGVDSMRIVLTDNSGNLIATPRVDFDIADTYTVGIAEAPVLNVNLKVAPNPSSAFTSVRWSRPITDGTLSLIDAQGRNLRQYRLDAGQTDQTVDISSLPLGVYMLALRGQNVSQTSRLLKQ